MEKLKQLKLSDTSRMRIAKELGEYTDFHTVRTGEGSRSTKQVSQSTFWYTALFAKPTTMPLIAIFAAVLIGGGTSLAAQGSVPGDLLYPVKVGVNENIRSAIAVGADSEARLEAKLLEERVQEAMELKNEGRLEGELATEVNTRIAAQSEIAERASNDADSEVEADTSTRIRLALASFKSLTAGGDSLAINTEADTDVSMNTRLAAKDDADESSAVMMSADAESTSMMALEPIDVGQLQQMTTARMESLRELLERHKDDISAEIHAEFSATLDAADELMMQVMVQSSTDRAREILFEVADLVGKVEAALTTMGEATIDTETGAILEIDFSKPPALEPDRGDADTDPLPLPPEILEPVDSGQSSGGVDADAVMEATTELTL